MITVRIVPVACQAAKDLSTSFACVFFCFQDDSAATFAHDEAVAVCIERSACRQRIRIFRKCLRLCQSGHDDRAVSAFAADYQYHVCLSGVEQHCCNADGISTGRACCAYGKAGTVDPV